MEDDIIINLNMQFQNKCMLKNKSFFFFFVPECTLCAYSNMKSHSSAKSCIIISKLLFTADIMEYYIKLY